MDKIHDSPASGIGASYTRQNDIKSQRLDVIQTANDSMNIVEPSSPTHSQYPYNRVEQSQSGHIREIDDTPGAERILEMHRSGTFYEIHPDGSRVLRVYGDNFEISLSDNNLIVGGDLNITVQGDANILSKGNMRHKCGGDYELIVHGNMTTRVEGSRIDYTKGAADIQTGSDLKIRSEGITDVFSKGNLDIQTANNMIIAADDTFTGRSGGKYLITSGGSYNIKVNSNYNLESDGTVYIDGTQVHFNLPGAGVTGVNPVSNDPLDSDPSGGLTIEDSISTPSIESLHVTKTNNSSLSGIVDTSLTTPKDRTTI